MSNSIDLDQAIGLAFKMAHRMRATQVSAGWDAVDRCLDPAEYETNQTRAQLFATFLITPDARHLSSYALRAEALETAMIAMEGVISRCRIAFQSRASGEGAIERENAFIQRLKDTMTGAQVCKDANTILNQMIDLQTQLLQSMENETTPGASPKAAP